MQTRDISLSPVSRFLLTGWLVGLSVCLLACGSDADAPASGSSMPVLPGTAGGAAVTGAAVSCTSNLLACSGVCVDTLRDAKNCGACGVACGPGQVCEGGQCAAPCPQACVGGQICNAGVCQCPPGLQLCAGMCVDLTSTPAHCGMCGQACAQGQVCQNSTCACVPAQTLCGDSCADLQLSPQHCGACGHACETGEVCMAGVCRGPVGADGCSGEPTDLTISEVSAYQSIKSALSKNTTPIEPEMRTTQLVQGRDTMFRISVAVGNPFNMRELSARVTVKNAGREDEYFAKQLVSKSSTDDDTSSTFNVLVPAKHIQADTRYKVQLVECGGSSSPNSTPPTNTAGSSGGQAGAGAPARPGTRFPAEGELELAAVDTGTLKVKVIPLRAGMFVPDTSEPALQKIKDFVLAMYPVADMEITVGEELSARTPVNWNSAIEQVRAQRQADSPPPEVYYMGLITPAASAREYCSRGCVGGLGSVGSATQPNTRFAVAVGFGDSFSMVAFTHELAHNHGRNHAPCPQGQISAVDREYPHANAQTGVWGYDPRDKKFLSPTMTTDLMAYCDPMWISDYTYNGLLERSLAVNVSTSPLVLDLPETQIYWVALDEPDSPRWSIPFPAPAEPYGEPESAEILDIDGRPIEVVTVYRTRFADSDASSVLIPEPKQGWHAVRLRDRLALPFTAPVTVPAN